MNAIKTQFIAPPIPTKDYDWEAYREGCDEGGLVGYGATKEAAIQDLMNREAESKIDEL